MKKNSTTNPLLLFAALLCIYSCSKSSDNKPGTNGSGGSGGQQTTTVTIPKVDTLETNLSLQTTATYVVGHDSVVSGGYVYNDGGGTITARGVCWSTSQSPTIANNKTVNGTGTGFFSSPVGGLTVNTTYYIRAYATNSAGTGYSPQQQVYPVYMIGEHSQGGYVYWIDQSTVHGLVVTLEDLSEVPWENTTYSSYLSVGAWSTSDGAGNTAKIIAGYGNTGNAAAVCSACRDGGFTDWFLPASDQLNALTGWLYTQAHPLPASNVYWSSTEWSSNVQFAMVIEGQLGSLYGNDKFTMNSVRAIRAF